jgi:hypothetical protein
MAIDPNIALGFKGVEIQNPMNAMLQATQLQQSQMQMQAYQRERDALSKMQEAIAAKGGPSDLGLAADEMLKSGVPHFMDMGFKIKEKMQRQKQLSDILGGPSAAPGAAPAAMGEPAAAPMNAMVSGAAPVAPGAPVNAMPGTPAPYTPVVPRNAMVAPAGAPAGTPPTVDTTIQDTYRKIDQLHAIGEHELAKSLEQRVKDKLPPTAVQEFEYAKKNGYKGPFETFKTLQAPRTTVNVPVNVSTEKKYGERFGGLIADADAAKLSAAEGAPAAAANADRITDLIASGKVITGTGANARLQIAKALNLAGGNDSDKIRNTEVLISSLAETTLGAIKSSNLGAGQGFTNADRDFLEKAKAGQLTYDSKSLAELARLSRLAAEKSAESWNTRVKQIPGSALEGTGISTAPVVIPPRKPASVMNIPAGAIEALKAGQGSAEQFDSIFGPGSAARALGTKGK